MNCPTCGGDNREGARFCRHCGLPTLRQAVSPIEAAEATAGASDTAIAQETGTTPAAPEEAPPAGQDGGSVQESATDAGVEPLRAPAEPAEPAAGGGAGAPLAAAVPEAGAGLEPGASLVQVAAGADGGEPESAEESSLLPEAVSAEAGAPIEPGEPPLVALPAGTVLAGRYLLVEASDRQEDQIRYAARDLCRCSLCGFEANSPDDAYCAQCGGSLPGSRAIVPVLQVRDPQSEPPGEATLSARFSESGCHFLVLEPSPPERAPQAKAAGGLRLLWGQATHPGRVRPLNEDGLLSLVLAGSSLRTQPDASEGLPRLLGLFVVADGMGGHEGGEVASRLALHVFGSEVVRAMFLPAVEGRELPAAGVPAILARSVEAANDAVFLARQKLENDMGTTLTATLVLDDRLFLAHVGDCRALGWNSAGLDQLTADHSLIAGLVAAGRATPEEVYTHPQRSVILRSIGDRPMVEVDTAEFPLAPGDRIVLCTDGLWELLRNEGIADVLMQEPDPQAAAELLVARANAAGGEDNITVLVAQVEHA